MKFLMDGHVLDLQHSFFNMTIATNNEPIVKEDYIINTIIWMWAKIISRSILECKFLEFKKLVETTCVQVFEIMEDGCSFLVVVVMKNKLKNYLIYHLDMCIHFYVHIFYIIENSFLKRPSLNGGTWKAWYCLDA